MSVLKQVSTSLGFDRSTAGQRDAVLSPRVRQTRPPILYMHGAGGNASEAVGDGVPSVRTLLYEVASAGYTISVPTTTLLWGNTTCINRMTDSIAWNRTSLGSSNDPVVLIGASHGAVSSLSWISENPGTVACAILIIPAVDMEDIRTTNALGMRTSIDAAWGVSYPAPLPPGANPAQNTNDYLSTPIQIWYADDDTICTTALTTAFGATISAEMHSVGNLGHTDAAIAAVDSAQVLSFINTYV